MVRFPSFRRRRPRSWLIPGQPRSYRSLRCEDSVEEVGVTENLHWVLEEVYIEVVQEEGE